jgi:hypothetical protein
MIVIVDKDGQVTAIAHDSDLPLLESVLGPIEARQRGGHVIPAAPVKRWAFRLLRKPGIPSIAAWTRRWRGQWVVDLTVSGGSVLGPFATRLMAIEAEESWLAEKLAAIRPAAPPW